MTPGAPEASALDHPDVRARLFHPRTEPSSGGRQGDDLTIPVGEGVRLGARFHALAPDAPTYLFFHGNGEIVADYDELAPLFKGAGVNFLPVDYRGYGRSTGEPSAAALLADAHAVLDRVGGWLAERGFGPTLLAAGRSLGSAPALELAARRGDGVAGLLLESAFARTLPLLRTLGLDPDRLGLREEDGFGNLEKVARYRGPTVVIHGDRDTLIPPGNARALAEASGAPDPRLVFLPGADHNTVFLRGAEAYRRALAGLAGAAGRGAP